MSQRVLIAGAGIAGPTLAYWLLRAGMVPTLLEAAPTLRNGGYMIDFWGIGYAVAERMGLSRKVREAGYQINEIRLIDRMGSTRARISTDAIRRVLGDRYTSVLRGDLARILYRNVADEIETLFADEICELSRCHGGVEVHFARAAPRRFDIVIGADGVHSSVRRLVFGGDNTFEYPLGYHVAAFTSADYPWRDELAYVSRTEPGRQIARCALRDGRTVFFVILRSNLVSKGEIGSVASQKCALARNLRGIGAEELPVLSALESCDDLYFDTVNQTRLHTWSKGRVALVGDAAYAPSLLAGQGASFAMAGAYILAGELARNCEPARAFAAYEQRFKPFLDRKQRNALHLGAWFAPRTQPALFVRDWVTRLAGIPALSRFILGRAVQDTFVLPYYALAMAPIPLHRSADIRRSNG